ncbi:NAD(P)/FAD-dependent oxidoreductase [Spirosoma arcticum]
MATQVTHDAIIVGGSVAGLSAALVLGRSLRRVLVVDGGKPCNRQTPHSHSFMTRDGETPAQLTVIARQQALAYPTVSFMNGNVVTLTKNEVGFSLSTDQGESFRARKVLLATGVEDMMPPLPGFAECWGRSVLHCPYCHGYEVQHQPLGVLAHPDHVMMQVPLIRHWSKNLTLFTNGTVSLTTEQRDTIQRLNVPIVETPIQRIRHENGMMTAFAFADGSALALTALFAAVPFRQHSDLAQQVGCTFTETGLIGVSLFGETSVPGLFAAGDNSSPLRQLAIASANGGTAGAGLNRELINDDTATA